MFRIRDIGLGTFLFLLPVVLLFSQDEGTPPPLPEEMIGKSVYIVIQTSVQGNSETGFQKASSRLTLPGKPVTVRLKVRNGRIIVNFTPYLSGEGQYVLLVQNEVWIRSAEDGPFQYFTSVSSIPVRSGDRAHFYPMGKKNEGEFLQMIVVIVPYAWVAEQGMDPESLLVDHKP